jgi:deoxyxylulose-5-phosphate synthase
VYWKQNVFYCSATFVQNTVCSNKYSCIQDVRRNICRSITVEQLKETKTQKPNKKKNTTMLNFMKIRLAVSELLHVDRGTDMAKLIGVLLQLSTVKKPKIIHVSEKAIILKPATSTLFNLLLLTGKVLPNTAPI